MGEWHIQRRGLIEVWTIEGEPRHNTLTRTLVEELEGQIARVRCDAELRAVVLAGRGEKAFCAGADLKARETMSDDEVRAWLGLLHRVFCELEQAPKIFVAAINGAAFGGGLELALACDLRVADPGAAMALSEVRLGIIPGGGGTQRLPRVVGVGRAKELILTGRRVLAAEALSMGLVNRLSAPGMVVEEACTLANEIAANAPLALAQAKRAIDEGFALSLMEGCSLEKSLYDPLLETEDRREGLKAFKEKRSPVYRGV